MSRKDSTVTSPRLRPLRAVAAALLSTFVLGCSADSAEPESKSSPSTLAPAPAKIEKIAARTGCEPEIRIEADELREGVCSTARGQWTVTTFPQERFKETWLEAAAVYGGTYLVGPKWAIAAEPALLGDLRAEVGGEMRKLRGTNPSPAAS
jgi:hypothetical protein